MYAVIRTAPSGGKQTTVRPGEIVDIEKIDGHVGSEVVFDQVLLVHDDAGVTLGRPHVATARVVGEIVAQRRAPKIRIYRFKRRKGYSKTRGHRQPYTRVLIKEIQR